MGSGYGESSVVHLGDGIWMIVDSYVNAAREPQPLRYLADLGVDFTEAVALVVATHWHDDHVRGLSQVVDQCRQARFFCSAALVKEEFLGIVGTMNDGSASHRISSGVREMRQVLGTLVAADRDPHRALADRRIFQDANCEVWTLSPDDPTFNRFLTSLVDQIPESGQTKGRVPALSPNEVSVALWLRVQNVVALLGADLERRGWRRILSSKTRPTEKATAFKIPHHGSLNADEPAVWDHLLESEPIAILTPWNLAGGSLPQNRDVKRIQSRTRHAYATAPPTERKRVKRSASVERTLRQSGIGIRRREARPGLIQLRRSLNGGDGWKVKTLGSALHLPLAM